MRWLLETLFAKSLVIRDEVHFEWMTSFCPAGLCPSIEPLKIVSSGYHATNEQIIIFDDVQIPMKLIRDDSN